ncbi:HNH endonuclease signature motif containing protein [Corynebacterium bovis]|uniref:HNH endonuclease signature motif containing protein n=1 Tax=Corynebacterium bovis TaxID=36808 RepID=UPI003138AFA1
MTGTTPGDTRERRIDRDRVHRHVLAVNRVELRLAEDIHRSAPGVATCLAVRGRGRYDATRMAHAGELSDRMPDLWPLAVRDGRLSLDHMEVLWQAVHRLVRHLDRTADAVDREELTAALDRLLEGVVLDLLDRFDQPDQPDQPGPLDVARLRTIVGRVLATAAPGPVADGEAQDRTTGGVRRRGRTLTVTCRDEATAVNAWSSITATARTMAAGSGRTVADCRLDAALELLGAGPSRTTVHLHVYRQPGGPGFIPGVGWVSPSAARAWASRARHVREHPATPPPAPGYRIPDAMRDTVRGRDGRCRFPGCDVPATACDIDHIEPYDHAHPERGGATAVGNLQCLCRHHHNLKTGGLWRARARADTHGEDTPHTVTWTAPDGTHHRTVADGPLA